MTHVGIWSKIDKVAAIKGVTPSALARGCHMDATAFNKSKRWSKDGQPRWPSAGTLAKVIDYAGMTDEEFFQL